MGAFDPPPPEWDSGPFPQGPPKYKYFSSRDEVDRYCRGWGIAVPAKAPRGSKFYACYIPTFNMIAMVDPEVWPNKWESKAIKRHEEGHARGGQHGADQHKWEPAPWFLEVQHHNALSGAYQPPQARNALAPQGR